VNNTVTKKGGIMK